MFENYGKTEYEYATEQTRTRARNILIDDALRAVIQFDRHVRDRLTAAAPCFGKLDVQSRREAFKALDFMMESDFFELEVSAPWVDVFHRLSRLITAEKRLKRLELLKT